MTSSFSRAIHEQQAHIEKLIEEREHGTPMSYAMLQAQGVLKPFAVRLPVTTLAMLDVIQGSGLWTKQEMVFQMIQSGIQEFRELADEQIRAELDKAAKVALEVWKKKHKGKDFDPRVEKFVSKVEQKPSKGRKGTK